jgi:hypothetical protein
MIESSRVQRISTSLCQVTAPADLRRADGMAAREHQQPRSAQGCEQLFTDVRKRCLVHLYGDCAIPGSTFAMSPTNWRRNASLESVCSQKIIPNSEN